MMYQSQFREPLPVVASLYTTDAPARITTLRSEQRHVAALRERFRDAFGTGPQTVNRRARQGGENVTAEP